MELKKSDRQKIILLSLNMFLTKDETFERKKLSNRLGIGKKTFNKYIS